MKVLIACEESQAVCKAFRELGHEAYSCDIQECSGGHPEWHIRWDVLALINGSCSFMTGDGELHRIDGKWDLLQPTEVVEPIKGRRFQQKNGRWRNTCWEMEQKGGKDRAKERSKTFPGIARAMAEQWGGGAND